MKFFANLALFLISAYFLISAFGIWWLLGGGLVLLLCSIANEK
jgi:hypothetical protein